jgi:hypothetical protein
MINIKWIRVNNMFISMLSTYSYYMGTRRRLWMPFWPPFLTACERFVENTSSSKIKLIDRNCYVLPIEYDLLIVTFVNINITITIIVFFLNQYNVLSSTIICYLPIFCLCSLFAFMHGHMTAILTSREWYASNTWTGVLFQLAVKSRPRPFCHS